MFSTGITSRPCSIAVLERLVKTIPAPTGNYEDPLQALIIDSWFDNYLGVVSLVRVRHGRVKKGETNYVYRPGPVHTPLQPASRSSEEMEGFGDKSQLNRPGQPVEIATSFVFLASRDASLYYGQVLHPYPLGD